MNYPTLYKKTSTGKIQTWRIEVVPKVNSSLIVTTYGQIDGIKQEAIDEISLGKNIGKANETTPFEQAVLEAGSQWDKKKKKGYVENIEMAKIGAVDSSVILGGVPVMLAHKFSEQGHKIKYPCYVQPKLDGHRCVAVVQNGKCTLWTRTQKRITGVPHIERAIEALNMSEPVIFDGELYNHNYRENFEELTSFIRQETPKPGHEIVQYWIYDIAETLDFSDRLFALENLAKKVSLPLVVVETLGADNEDELMDIFESCRSFGFEGVMVRNASGHYQGRRSYNLQKIKEFDDAEFKIVGVEEGRGKMAGKGVFVCATSDGAEFKAKMKGDLNDLKKYFENPDKYVGKYVTVQYQGLTGKNGVPRFPVAVRLYEPS